MYLQLVVPFLLVTTIVVGSTPQWEEFKVKYNKKYATVDEEAERKQIFLDNIDRIHEHQRNNPHATYTIGINHLMDRRIQELLVNPKQFFSTSQVRIDGRYIQPKKPILTSLDWRERNVIAPVYNQGMQANDASVLTVEMIESLQAIKSGRLQRGSIAQVSACCENTIDILNCTLQTMRGRLCAQDDYDATSGTCNLDSCTPFANFNNLKVNTPGDEGIMLRWIQDSPLFVGINAGNFHFQSYEGGLLSKPDCPKDSIDHVLQVVGYGIESGKLYWICKNSWGDTWGEKGYIRIERGVNMCAIANYAAQLDYVEKSAASVLHAKHFYLFLFCLALCLVFNLQ